MKSPLISALRGRLGFFARVFSVLAMVGWFTAVNAQTTINPTSNTLQFTGNPAQTITAPNGAVILYGTATSAVTGQPVRHLWVADGIAGICRVDPDIDSPGPYAINPGTCPFQLNRSPIRGGAMAFDSSANVLYFVDNQAKNPAGLARISYSPAGDNGNGSLMFGSLFSLGGNTGRASFPAGQTLCPFPGNTVAVANSVALGPDGNLWVGFGKSASILRVNSPGTVNTTNFGSCAQLIQIAATTPNNRVGSGLAWIGHDLWGADAESPFVIPGADTNCLVGPNAACNAASRTVVPVLPSILGATALASDQVYPATNGNNLYFAVGSNVAWVGNAVGGPAGQTLAPLYMNSSQVSGSPLANIAALAVDGTDPANLVLYAGDDPSGLGTTGAGRWWQTTQTAAGPDIPGAPLDINAVLGSGQVVVSWSPAQVAQAVTSYTVHNNFASNGATLPDVAVVPNGGGLYPPTSTTILGLDPSVAYIFQVSASNAQGSSTLSSPTTLANPLPSAPVIQQAIAGDTQAFVSWNVPSHNGGPAITSYTVTALVGGVPSGITATVPAPASSTPGAIISGLANGTLYTFTVHASNAAGDGPESAPSGNVNPASSNLPIMSVLVTGPISVNPVPALVTYHVTVTNTSVFPATNIVVNHLLSTTDGAFIIVGQPDQGSCSPGGNGVTAVACVLGTMAGGSVSNIDVVVQMQKAQITLSSRVTGTDVAGNSLTFKLEHRTTTPPGAPPPPNAPVVSVPVQANAIPTDLSPGKSGTIVWNVQNTSGVAANNVVLTITISNVVTINNVIAVPAGGANPASCNAPSPGLAGTTVVTCNIAVLGGAKAANPPTNMVVTLFYTAPNQTGLTLLPSGTVSFDGIDSSNPTAGAVLRVH